MTVEKYESAMSEVALPKGPQCSVAATLATIAKADPELGGRVRADIANPDIKAAHISRALQALNYRLAEQTIARHRRGICLCDR